MPIPKIVHFICIKPMTFSFIHYLGVMSAKEHIKPTTIYLYYDSEQEDNIYWEIIKNHVTMEQITPPEKFRGIPVKFPQYKADIIRLEKLLERGGIYLDIDVIVLKSFDSFLDHKCAIPGQPSASTQDITQLKNVTNAIIIAEPQHEFIQHWYNVLDQHIGHIWGYHAVCLPVLLLKKYPNLAAQVTILDCNNQFIPFGWEDRPPFIFDSNQNDKLSTLDSFHTIMFFQTIVFDIYLKNLSPKYILTNNNIFSQLCIQYVDHVVANSAILSDYIEQHYSKCHWEKVADLFDQYTTIVSDENIRSVPHQRTVFRGAYAFKQLGKITRSIQLCNTVLEVPLLDSELEQDVRQLLGDLKQYHSLERSRMADTAMGHYLHKNWDQLQKVCGQYDDYLLEGNAEYQRMTFFKAYMVTQTGDIDGGKQIYRRLLNVKDLNPDVRCWSEHNIKVVPPKA